MNFQIQLQNQLPQIYKISGSQVIISYFLFLIKNITC